MTRLFLLTLVTLFSLGDAQYCGDLFQLSFSSTGFASQAVCFQINARQDLTVRKFSVMMGNTTNPGGTTTAVQMHYFGTCATALKSGTPTNPPTLFTNTVINNVNFNSAGKTKLY
jgi:hypothetical protein